MSTATQGDPWWLGAATFGSKLLETSSEVANEYARAKLREELNIDELVAKQRANDATTNAEVLALNAPVTGKNSDGSTLIQEQVSFAGVTVQRKNLEMAGLGLAALMVAAIAYKAIM